MTDDCNTINNALDGSKARNRGMIDEDAVCEPVPDVIAEEVDGEWLIVPLNTQGNADADDALYTLNATGRWLWQTMDGKRSLGDIADEMAACFHPVPNRETRMAELIDWTATMLAYGLLRKC